MSFYDQFIPGQWIDNIDTNDFINLNKKPFFKEPVFLKKSSEKMYRLFEELNFLLQQEKNSISLQYSSDEFLTLHSFSHVDEQLPSIFTELLQKRIGSSENIHDMKSFYHFEKNETNSDKSKTTYELFDEVATSEIKKSIKIGLFKNTPALFNSSFLFPDFRSVALYGTKRLMKEKLYYLKKSEKHLQTHEWIRNRIDTFEQIEQLKNFEKFSKRFSIDVKNPATSAQEAIAFSLLAIYYCFIENPSVYFTLGHLFSFFDIYIENDLLNGTLTEEKAQDLIDEFYLKISLLRFVYTPNLVKEHPDFPQFFGETFGGNLVTKTTYRILSSIQNFKFYPFSIRILWDYQLPEPFLSFCNDLLNDGIPVSFLKQNSSTIGPYEVALPYGMLGIPGDDILLDAGTLDLEKVFYLSLNGGKDIDSNSNLMPVTQPIRGNKFDFDEVMHKFKDYLSYCLSIYVEKVNIVFYLYETKRNESFKKALMSNLPSIKAQFNFSKLIPVSHLLSAIQHCQIEIKRKNNWIESIVITEDQSENIEWILLDLISYIEKEIKKIPLYKKGTALVRFYQKDMDTYVSFKETQKLYAFPFEMVGAKFPIQLYEPNTTEYIPFIEDLFSRDFSEINVFSNTNHYCLNSVLYHKEHYLSKRTEK